MDPVTPPPEVAPVDVAPVQPAPAVPPPVVPAAVTPPVMSYASPTPFDPKLILAKLTLADKIIAGAALVGIIATFLPIVSISIDFMGMKQTISPAVIRDWRGVFGLLCCIGALVVLFLMVQGTTVPMNLLYALLGCCGGAALFGLLILIAASGTASAALGPLAEMGKDAKDAFHGGTGFGAYLFFLCGLAMAGGGFLKAKAAGLIPGGTPPTPAA